LREFGVWRESGTNLCDQVLRLSRYCGISCAEWYRPGVLPPRAPADRLQAFVIFLKTGLGMPKKPIKIEIFQEVDERFLQKEYADGSEERVPIVKLSRKPPRYRYRTVTLDKGKKKGF
jgi:hypothetical protein